MSIRIFLAALLLTALAGGRATAHHSFAATFDASKAVRVSGTLAKVEWTNPHIYFYVDVTDDKGAVTRWACESGAPGALSRRGFKRSLLKLGDTLIVDGYQAKNGANLMDARRVTLPDGTVLVGASAGDGGPQ